MFIECDALNRIPRLKHASTTKAFNPNPAEKQTELRRLADLWNVSPRSIIYGNQRHTDNIRFIDEKSISTESKPFIVCDHTDAVGTDVPNIMLAVYTADCVPIFLVDIAARRFALAHSGWRGTLSGIAPKALQTMRSRGSRPEDIIVWLAPSIGICCYEVSPELAQTFADACPNAPDILDGRNLDLRQVIAWQLIQNGIPAGNIHKSPHCTRCRRDMFYSYRGGDKTGRIINAAMILD